MAENNNFEEMAKGVLNTEDTTAEFDANDINDNKVMAVLSYIWLLFLIPLFAAPNSKYARFHTNQGLVFFLADLAAGIAVGILSFILVFIPFIGWIISAILSAAVGIASLALMILGIVNAAQGKAKKLPLIGKITILK